MPLGFTRLTHTGGWEFSDAGTTRHTWSVMASSKTNRDAFVASLLKLLDKWNFAGVDIDWEWPGAETRGGNPAIDKQNQVDLMKELREALGSRGLGVVMPAQYEYLKHLNPKALESSVDFFNILAYDLHGPWDATIPGLGPLIKPHTDLEEIDTALHLFWFDDINPSKINLGVANYGRGYTLADSKCAHYGCTWTGPSKSGECTELAGVLSQCEIQRIISQKQLKPNLITDSAGVKQIVFDGQWIGYADNETLGMKTELANDRCLGGTALWAIDYASCGRSGGPGGPGAPHSSAAAPSLSSPGISNAPSASIVPSISIAPSSVSSVLVQPSVPVVPSNPVASVPQSSISATSTEFVLSSTYASSTFEGPTSITITGVKSSSTLASFTSTVPTSVASLEPDLPPFSVSSAFGQSTSAASTELLVSSTPDLSPIETSTDSLISTSASFVPEQPMSKTSTELATSSRLIPSTSATTSTMVTWTELTSPPWYSEISSAWTSSLSSEAMPSSPDATPSNPSQAESYGTTMPSTLESVSMSTEWSILSSADSVPTRSTQNLSTSPVEPSGSVTLPVLESTQSTHDITSGLGNSLSATSMVESTRVLSSTVLIVSPVEPSASTTRLQTTFSVPLASSISATASHSLTTFL